MYLASRRAGTIAALVCAFVITFAASAFAQNDTLLIHGDDMTTWQGADQSVADYLNATNILPGNVQIFDASSNTGSAAPASLAGYRSVLVWGDINIYTLYGFADPVALGNALGTFVQNGGIVVLCHVSHLWAQGLTTQLEGSFLQNSMSPFQVSAQYDDTTTVTLGQVALPGHPVMQGVTTADAGTYPWHSPLQLSTGADLIASWNDSTPLVAVKQTGQGYVFGLNFYPVGTNYFIDTIDLSTDIDTLVANCLAYTPQGGGGGGNNSDLTVAAGTNSASMVAPNAQGQNNGGISAATFTIANSTATAGELTAIQISASGTGNDATAFSEVSIYQDANGNNQFDSGNDTRVGSAATAFPSDDGDLSFSVQSALQAIAANTTNRYFIVVKMSGSATAGQTFNFSVSDITVTAPGTKTGVPMASAMSGVEILSGNLSVAATAGTLKTRFANEQGPGGNGFHAASFSIANGAVQANTVTSITIEGAGTADHTTIYTEFAIYRDATGGTTSSFDAADVLIGKGNFAGSPATTTISVTGTEQAFALNQTKDYLIVVKLNGSASPGATINYRVSAVATGNGMIGGVPSSVMNGIEVQVPSLAFSDLSGGTQVTAYPGTDNVVLQAIEVQYPSGPQETLTSLTFQSTGSGHDVDHLSSLGLYRDDNANSSFDPGTDLLVSSGSPAFSADDGNVVIALDAAYQALPSNTSYIFFLVASFNLMPGDGAVFQTRLANVSGPSGGLAITGIPAPAVGAGFGGSDFAAGARITANGLIATLNSATSPVTVVDNDATDLILIDFSLRSLATNWAVSSLTLQAAGTANDQTAYSELALYEDTNGNGTFDGAPDDQIASPKAGSFPSDDGGIAFTLNNGMFPSNTSRRFFLIGDLAGTADAGATLKVFLGLVSGTPSTGIANIVGVPTAEPAGYEISPATMSLTLNGPTNAQPVNSNDSGTLGEGVLLYDLSVEAVNGGFSIASFEFTASGSGDDSMAFSEIALYEDKDGNGMFDGSATDTLAGVKVMGFPADDGAITYTVADNAIAAAETRRFFLLGILNGNAQPGDTFNFELTAIDALPDTTGVIGSLPASGATALVIGQSSLTVSGSPFNPSNSTRLRDGTDFTYALGAIRLAANNGNAVVNGLTLTAGGSADWSTTLAGGNGIRLYRDDGDQTFSATNDALLYSGAGGAFTLPVTFNSAIMLSSGQTADIWLVLNVLGTAGGSQPRTFQLSVISPTDVMGSGVSNIVLGSPNPASSTLTLIEFRVETFTPTSTPDAGGADIEITGVGLVGANVLKIGGIDALGSPTVLPDGTRITGWRVPEGEGVNLPIVLSSPVLGDQTLSFTFSYSGTPKSSSSKSGGGGCAVSSGESSAALLALIVGLLGMALFSRRREA